MYEVAVHRDIRIPTDEPGVTLSADLFTPKDAGPVPVLVTVLPYRRDLAAMSGSVMQRWFASRGYACLLVDLRGTGSSDGTQRPPFDPEEVDDALAAIDWAIRQPWCDGPVGMWGESYGAMMAMRTAARRPPALKAIIAVQGTVDPERDFTHPGGTRGAAMPLGIWARNTMLAQMLPPLDDYIDPAEQARWRRRLAATPYLLDLFRHGPGDPAWAARRIDASAIDVPALCVAGWRDLFVAGMIEAYERMAGPKRLIAGPWMHGTPQLSPHAPIDFLALAKEWWDRWLRGIPDAADAPPVSVHVQGAGPRWLGFATWPPPATVRDIDLSTWSRVEPPRALDPAVGALSGLWATPDGPYGLPLDQHDDDIRSLCYTSPPLEESLLIGGRPSVMLSHPARRVSLKLTDVDPVGRSTLICAGLETEAGRIVLSPTTYEVPAGHRLRLAIAPGDFPRVWPTSPDGRPTAGSLSLPIARADDAIEIEYPVPDLAELAFPVSEASVRPVWAITNDLLGDTVSVRLASGGTLRGRGHRLSVEQELVATAHRTDPAASTVTGCARAAATMATGERVAVQVELNITSSEVEATGLVTVDGETLLDRQWRDAVPRKAADHE